MKTRLDFLKELAFPLKDFVSKLDINVSSYEQEKGYLCEEDVLVNNFIIDQISSCFLMIILLVKKILMNINIIEKDLFGLLILYVEPQIILEKFLFLRIQSVV